MIESLIGVAIVLSVLLVLSGIFGLIFLVSRASTSGLRRCYATSAPFAGRGVTAPYVKIGFMSYQNLVRLAANGAGLHLSVPVQPPVFIPWSDVEITAGPAFALRPLVTLRARLAPDTPIVIPVKVADELQREAGPAWPVQKNLEPAAREYDVGAARELKALGSPHRRDDR